MQNVTADWEQTHRDNLTRQAGMLLSFEFPDGTSKLVSDSRLVSFNYNKSGDILSGVLTQDTVTFTFDNFDRQFSYDPVNDNYTGGTVTITCSFLRGDYELYDGIRGGTYYITDVQSEDNKITFTAKSILAFMKKKIDGVSGACDQAVISIILDARSDPAVPDDDIQYVLDSCLGDFTCVILNTDGYSQAEALQLIANECSCVLFVDRLGKIHIERLETISENYVLSEKISFEFPKPKVLEKIGRVTAYYDHGTATITTSTPGETSGATQTLTNPIIDDYLNAGSMVRMAYEIQQGARQRITGNFRADPRIDLFDVIAVPYQNKVAVCCLTKINFTYNGGWRGTYEAVQFVNGSIDLRICDLEMLKIEQFESLRIEQLEPNTISDDLGYYLATSDGRLTYWKEDEPDNG